MICIRVDQGKNLAIGGKEREESCETTNLHFMNVYLQNTFVGVCELDD